MTAVAIAEGARTVRVLTDAGPVFEFRSRYQEFCLTNDGAEGLYHFGEVVCPSCGRSTAVSAQLGEVEFGCCPRCRTPIPVRVDPLHLRMDDSRSAAAGHGCVCGDRYCQEWEAV